jgi:hypothetical protein
MSDPDPIPAPTHAPYCTGWISTTQLTSGCVTSAASGLPEETIQSAIDSATEWLYIKSGQMFAGVCSETVRPYSQRSRLFGSAYYAGWAWGSPGGWWGWDGGWWGGAWVGGWSWECGCGSLSEVNLDYWPIVTIDAVKVNGLTLDPTTDYRLDENRLLVRLPDADGNRRFWPDCQRMDLPDTEQDTWSVTLTYGQQPTPLAVDAVTELAFELLKPCLDQECSIPVNVRSVNRQGVSYQLVGFEPDEGRGKPLGAVKTTGLRKVDLFLSAYNPGGIRPATVYSPDIEPRARRIGT